METTPAFPNLETKRLILRRLTFDDVSFIFQHFSDPHVTQYLLDEDPLTRREEAKEMIQQYADPTGKTFNRWGIALKADGKLAGTCGFHKWNRRHRRAEVGYDLDRAHWGQGIMAEALHAALSYAFDTMGMGLNRVDALVYAENTRSVRLASRLGFRSEGTLREYFLFSGEFYDHQLFSLLRRDWVARGRSLG